LLASEAQIALSLLGCQQRREFSLADRIVSGVRSAAFRRKDAPAEAGTTNRRLIAMFDFALSPAASQWINVVLIWVGFGTLVGLLATVIFPFRRPAGPFWAVATGIIGSTIGLLGLSWLFPDRELNPISPLGFLAATLGAFVLLVLYRIGFALFGKPESGPDNE
jgi:uncharacterized membrane protein YeaQ/YmgE (transglycosylase-associated protein family)